ncbi:hypothetical protein ACVHNB_18535 [Streptomyces sp. YJ-C3]
MKVAPELEPGETLAARQGETRGGRIFAFPGGEKGNALVVAVRRKGKGEMKVDLEPLRSTFSFACVDGEVRTTYNQLDVSGAEKNGTVSVSAPSTMTWSMTIGRGEPAQEEG